MNDKVHLLLIDDEKNYLLVLETLLTEAGYAVTALNDPETALAFLEESEVDIVITDMKMPRISGREVLERVKKNWPHIPVLIMTAFGSIESAVEAMRYGAFNYITKPFSNDELLLSIQNAAELARAHRQYQLLRESLEERYGKHQIIGRSRAIRDMLALVDRAGPSRATVLITGESGTGKELVARAIHFSSPRSQEPFVSVNCMALNPGVLESELFGHEKGSFTGAVAMRRGRFEQASGGTLFLDEVGELTPELQVKLLRVLQERRFERVGGSEEIEVDIRIVAATNKDLMPLVQAGTFREALYSRLNVVHIPIPPLRERREDIPLLVAHFAEKAAKENGIPPKTFSTEALNHLSGYEWPGNIRQLQNVVERCLVLVPGDVITLEDLPAEIRDEEAQFKSAVDLLPVQLDLADTLERIEAALIRRALVRADFVQAKAAELLGISKSLMQYKLKKYSGESDKEFKVRKSRAKLHDYIDEFQLLSSKNDEMMTKKAENTATVAKTASDSKNAIPKSDLLNKSPKIVKTSMLARLVEYYISARAQFGQSDIWWELPLKVPGTSVSYLHEFFRKTKTAIAQQRFCVCIGDVKLKETESEFYFIFRKGFQLAGTEIPIYVRITKKTFEQYRYRRMFRAQIDKNPYPEKFFKIYFIPKITDLSLKKVTDKQGKDIGIYLFEIDDLSMVHLVNYSDLKKYVQG